MPCHRRPFAIRIVLAYIYKGRSDCGLHSCFVNLIIIGGRKRATALKILLSVINIKNCAAPEICRRRRRRREEESAVIMITHRINIYINPKIIECLFQPLEGHSALTRSNSNCTLSMLPSQILGNATRIVTGQTGRTVTHALRVPLLHVHSHGGHQTVHAQIGQAVRSNVLRQLIRIQFVGNQLLPRGNVDSHVAGVLQRRTGDSDVHLSGARVS